MFLLCLLLLLIVLILLLDPPESHAPPTSPRPPLHQHSVSTPWTNRPSASVITDRRHSSDSKKTVKQLDSTLHC